MSFSTSAGLLGLCEELWKIEISPKQDTVMYLPNSCEQKVNTGKYKSHFSQYFYNTLSTPSYSHLMRYVGKASILPLHLSLCNR